MRCLMQNANDTFRVKAYAGTNSVLLAFDLDQTLKPGLLGFAIEQKEAGKQWQWLLNSLTFPGKIHTLPKWNATPSRLAPIQKFRWGDYVIDPGTTCRYRVYPAHGDPDNPLLGVPLEVEVKTDDGQPAGQRVCFNRAVAASQAFGRNFPNLDELLSENKDLPIEEWPPGPRAWLENGLLDMILDFIDRAAGPGWALDIAIYEYELKSIVEAVDAACGREVKLRVLYHAKKGDDRTDKNKDSLKKIPASAKRSRVTSKIFHDKFIILSRVNGAGERTPCALLGGSTNFTENGVYRQANVMHVTEDAAVVERYFQLFEQVWDNPEDVSSTRAWINQNNTIESNVPVFAGFSPRSHKKDLEEFIRIINGAQKDLLFATAFALPEDILEALLGSVGGPVLRFGVQNTASTITGYHADRNGYFTATALLKEGLEGWIKEGLKGQKGNLLIHTKIIITDFTTDHPVIISGSHNLSASASNGNDEHYLIIRDNTHLADRYGLEVLRFYEHYRFRYASRHPDKAGPTSSAGGSNKSKALNLAVDDSWADAYYTPGHRRELERLRFAGR